MKIICRPDPPSAFLMSGDIQQQFKNLPFKKHLIISPPRTLGTAMAREISHNCTSNKQGHQIKTNIIFDEVIRAFSSKKHNLADMIQGAISLVLYTVHKTNEPISNITIHDYPEYILPSDAKQSLIHWHKAKKFLSSFDSITYTIRAPQDAITSYLKCAFLEVTQKTKSGTKITIPEFSRDNLTHIIENYKRQLISLGKLLDLTDYRKTDIPPPISVIDVTLINKEIQDTIHALPAKDNTQTYDACVSKEVIFCYNTKSPDNPFKKSALAIPWSGVKKTSEDPSSRIFTEQVEEMQATETFKRCMEEYNNLKGKIIKMHKQEKLNFVSLNAN